MAKGISVVAGFGLLIGVLLFSIDFDSDFDEQSLNNEAYNQIRNINEHACAKELSEQIRDFHEHNTTEEIAPEPKRYLEDGMLSQDKIDLVKYLPLKYCATQNILNVGQLTFSAAKLKYLRGAASAFDTFLSVGFSVHDNATACEAAMIRIKQYCPSHTKEIGFRSPFEHSQ